jgi:outer membrane protein assembly factor BamD
MRLRLFCAALALGLAACHSGTSVIEKMGADQLFARGVAELKAHHWDNAIEAFDRLTLQYPSFARVQEARLDLAEAYLGKGDAVTAAGEFDRLATDFPLGAYADDARFGVCRAYEKLSPAVQLDQQYTQSAIDHCNSLLAYYPNSPFVPQAKEIVQRLTEKLAEKGVLAGEFYLKRHAFDSSLIYFEDVLKTYPTTNAAAQALFGMVQAYTALGYKEDAQSARERLMREYPSSQAAKTLAATGQARS